MSGILFKSLGIWLVIVVAAILNGIFREQVLAPATGANLALPLSGMTLAVLVFLVTLALVPYLGSGNCRAYILIGVFWLVLTLAFEFLFGHFIAGKSWQELLSVFDAREGDLFVVVLLVTAISPWLAARARGIC